MKNTIKIYREEGEGGDSISSSKPNMRNRARTFPNSDSTNELHDQHRWLFLLFLHSLIYRVSHLVSTHAHMNARTSERTPVLELLISTVSSWLLNFHEHMSHFRKLRAIANNRRDERLRSFGLCSFSCVKRRMDNCELFFRLLRIIVSSSKFRHIFDSISRRMERLKDPPPYGVLRQQRNNGHHEIDRVVFF